MPQKGFQPLDAFLMERKRIFLNFWANTGVGKSYEILTFPPPIYLFSMEADGPFFALNTAFRNGLINKDSVLINEVVYSALGDDIGAYREWEDDKKILDYLDTEIGELLADNKDVTEPGTIAIDTGSSLWDIIGTVIMEPIAEKREKQGKPLYRFDWRHANRTAESFLDRIRGSNFNLVISNRSAHVYNSKGDETQKMKYQGSKTFMEYSDLHGELQLDDKTGKRVLSIEKSRIDPEFRGEDVDDPTFENLYKELFGEE